MAGDDLPDTILVVIVAGLILSVGIVAASSLAGKGGVGEEYPHERHVLLESAGEWATVGDGEETGINPTVYDSRGYAIELTGASDSYFQSKQSVSIADDDTWSVSVWASADSSATADEMTAVSLDGRLVIVYDDPDSEWRAWYYDEGTRHSYQVNVSAPAQPATLANVQVVRNATTLAIYQNATRGETADVTTANIAPSPDADNWDGRVEELRAFDDALASGTRTALHGSPIDPQTGTNRTLRAMFDEPDRDTQLLLFTATSLETSNASYAAGIPGHELSSGGMFSAGDYDWRSNGPELKPNNGGELDAAPVAYVDYDATSELDSFVPEFTSMIGFAGLALVVFVIGTIVAYLQSVRGR